VRKGRRAVTGRSAPFTGGIDTLTANGQDSSQSERYRMIVAGDTGG